MRRQSTASSLRTRAPVSARASRPRLRPSSASVRRLPTRCCVQQARTCVGSTGPYGPPEPPEAKGLVRRGWPKLGADLGMPRR